MNFPSENCFQTFSTFLGVPGMYLEDLYVIALLTSRPRPDAADASCDDCERARLRVEWSVLDWNELAIGFCEGLGAKPMDEWTVFRLTGDSLRRLAEGG